MDKYEIAILRGNFTNLLSTHFLPQFNDQEQLHIMKTCLLLNGKKGVKMLNDLLASQDYNENIRDNEHGLSLYDYVLLSGRYDLTPCLNPIFSAHYTLVTLVTQCEMEKLITFFKSDYVLELFKTNPNFPFKVVDHPYFSTSPKTLLTNVKRAAMKNIFDLLDFLNFSSGSEISILLHTYLLDNDHMSSMPLL